MNHSISAISQRCSIALLLLCSAASSFAVEKKSSPWVATPLVSSDPKLSSSIGGLAAYLHQFDENSPASMFGITGTYSTSDSFVMAGFSQIFFDNDKQRILAGIAKGTINNDYDDYLGTGFPLKTKDDLKFGIAQYSYRIFGDWFVGGQGISSNYKVYLAEEIGQEAFNDTNTSLTNNGLVELAGFQSNALGALAEFDNRDKQRSPSAGHHFKIHNSAYRKSLGGDVSFDAYQMRYSTYFSHGNGHVLAINAAGRWTQDAPIAGYSSINTKGYTRGQFLAPQSSEIQIDERIQLTKDIGLIVYGAVACLYGNTDDDKLSCNNSDNIYPSISLGMTYNLNKEEGIVVRSEIAKGKGSSQGFYMTLGHPF